MGPHKTHYRISGILFAMVLSIVASGNGYSHEGVWFYHVQDYLAPPVASLSHEYPKLSWVPNIRGGNGVPDLHAALVMEKNQGLREAVLEFTGIQPVPETLYPTIIALWFGAEGPPDDNKMIRRILQKTEGLVFEKLGDGFKPVDVEILLEHPSESFARLCRIIEAVFELHYSTAMPEAEIIARILADDEPENWFREMKRGFPIRGGKSAWTIVQFFNRIQYVYEGMLALAKVRSLASQWSSGDDLFFRFVALAATDSVITDNVGAPARPESPAVIFGHQSGQALVGSNGQDFIFAGAGDNAIYGCGGDDVLVGGDGDTSLWFFKGDGRDTVFSEPVNSLGQATLHFPDRRLDEAKFVVEPGKTGAKSYDLRIIFPKSDEVFITPYYYVLDDVTFVKIRGLHFSDQEVGEESMMRKLGRGD